MRLFNPTNRKTECRVLDACGATLFFSYETCIGLETSAGKKMRRSNSWGPTTGRHFNESGCGEYPIVSDTLFARVLRGVIK